MVIAALAIGAITGTGTGTSSGPLAAISASAPPQATSQAANCAKVLANLPVQLGQLDPRVVHTTPDTPFVVAWGNPAVVLRCGVSRPPDLHPGSSTDFVAAGPDTGPYYDVTAQGGANVFTTVDRAAYVSVTVPSSYQGADVMPPLSRAIAAAMPAVCATAAATPNPDQLCTRRS